MEQKGHELFYDPSIGAMVHKISCGGKESLAEQSFIPPIPLSLVLALTTLPGKALGVFLIVWRTSVMQRSLTVKLTTTEVQQWGLSRHQKRRALRTLQAAGWIRVQGDHAHNPIVTLCLHVSPWAFQKKKSR